MLPPSPRNLLPAGQTANRLAVYEDIPLFWDAWDVELYHREKPVPASAQPVLAPAEVWRRRDRGPDLPRPADQGMGGRRPAGRRRGQITERGPLRAAVSFTVRVGDGGKSAARQTISLDAASPLVRFKTHVDWHENRRILKAEFPLDILADRALYETQFGTIARPTHSNTSWDAGAEASLAALPGL